MEYRYPPIYKYLALLIIYFMFMRHYKVITYDKYLPIAIIFVFVIMLFDCVMIDNHPYLTDVKDNASDDKDDEDCDDNDSKDELDMFIESTESTDNDQVSEEIVEEGNKKARIVKEAMRKKMMQQLMKQMMQQNLQNQVKQQFQCQEAEPGAYNS